MKFLILALSVSLFAVACNKKEEAAPADSTGTEEVKAGEVAPAGATGEGHDKEHHHVTDGVDHAHDDTHHADHDHKAHHPAHDEEVKQDPHTAQ